MPTNIYNVRPNVPTKSWIQILLQDADDAEARMNQRLAWCQANRIDPESDLEFGRLVDRAKQLVDELDAAITVYEAAGR